MIKKDLDGYRAKYKQNSEFSRELSCAEAKNIVFLQDSAIFCAYFKILHSLPNSVKNSAIAELQNPDRTDMTNTVQGIMPWKGS